MKSVPSPVCILVHSPSTRRSKYPRTLLLQQQEAGLPVDHAHNNSWGAVVDEEEEPTLRAEFPDVDGHLFDVVLNKGKSGLGLSIVANTNAQSVQGIVIMGVSRGGVAEKSGRVKWGDMILKVNETSVIGMSQQQFQELLASAPPTVRFVLLRQQQHINATSHPPTSSAGITPKPSVATTTTTLIKPQQQQQQQQQALVSDISTSLDRLARVRAVTLHRDDKLGLGLTIAPEVDPGGGAIVVVSSVTSGGPADLEGKLCLGDKILSVDGQKILGYAYEKVS